MPAPAGLTAPLRDLLAAQLALVAAQRAVARQPVGQLVAPVPVPPTVDRRPPSEELARAFAVARAVRRAATFGPVRARCLARSLAIVRLLAREGIGGAHIRIGVRRADGKFEAHAWVEHSGRPVSDPVERVAAFLPLVDVPADGLPALR